jgi:hypothetical protein
VLSKIATVLKEELDNTLNEQSKIKESIIFKEKELKLLYRKKIKHDQDHEIVKKNKTNIQSEFILIQKKLIKIKKDEINKLIKNNKKKDEIIKSKTDYKDYQLLEQNEKIKIHEVTYVNISNDLLETKKKYEVLQKNMKILELNKKEIFEKIIKINNSINLNNIVQIKSLNKKVSKTGGGFNLVDKIKKKQNLNPDKVDIDKTINEIFNKDG